MNEEFEHIGYWWLPEKPDGKIPGKLRFTPTDGANLTLQGSLKGSGLASVVSSSKFFNPPLVLGITSTGKAITLHQCFEKGTSFSSGGGVTSELGATWVFINAHFTSPDEVKFKSVSIHYAHLDSWANLPGFELDDHELVQGKLTLRYERPSAFQMELGDFNFSIGASGPSLSYDQIRQVKIGQKAWVRLKSPVEKPLEDFMGILHHIQNFLTLAMTRPTFPMIVGSTVEITPDSPDDTQRPDLPVDIFYQLPWWPGETKSLHSFEMLFTLPVVRDRLNVYIATWIQAAEMLKPVYDLYFSILYNPHMYVESTFISLSQAIETYHRRKIGGKYQPDEEFREGLYQKLVSVLPPELDKGFKQSLKDGKLLYANEYSLRKRLQDLVGRLSPNFPLNFIDANFVSKVCDTRNYLTHYDPDLREKSAQGVELYNLNEGLRTILEICFLEELGFAHEDIRKMLSSNRAHRHLLYGG
jgi:hypothetical protein